MRRLVPISLALGLLVALWFMMSGDGSDTDPLVGGPRESESSGTELTPLPEEDGVVGAVDDAGARVSATESHPDALTPEVGPARLTFECVAIETGAPLEGIGISLEIDDHALVPYAEAKERLSDVHGRLTFEVPPHALIRMQAWGETVGAGLVLGEYGPYEPGQDVRERLEHVTAVDVVFHGRIVDEETGDPVSGVTIEPVFEQEVEVGVSHATSDANGVFRLEVPSWRREWVWATSPGRGRISIEPVPGYETSSNARELRMPRESVLRGHVRRSDGSPARNVEVVARISSRNVVRPADHPCDFYMPLELRAAVDASGAYELRGLTSRGRYELTLEVNGEVAQTGEPAWFEPGEERVLDWTLLGSAAITGTLVDQNGGTGPWVMIWLVPTKRANAMRFTDWQESKARAVRTDVKGHFRFEGVRPGLWLVGPAPGFEADGEVFAPRASVVEVTGLEPEVEVNLTAWLDLSLKGRVVDEAGEPVPETTVTVWSKTDGTHHVTADAEGRFTAYGLSDETYEFTVGGWGYAWAESEPVRADPREPEFVEIVAVRGGRIRGRVLASDGKPAQGRVHIARRTVGEEIPSWTRTLIRMEGTYELSGLEPGEYDLLARSEAGEVATAFDVRVEAGLEPTVVDLDLVESGTLVLIADGDGAPDWTNATFFLDATFAGHGGTVGSEPAEIAFPAGRLEMVIEDALERTIRRSVDIRAGERTEVRIEAP